MIKTITAKISILILIAASALAFSSVVSAQNVDPVLAPAPAGCPGSATPIDPPPALCSSLPAGCPGSTQTAATQNTVPEGSLNCGAELIDCDQEDLNAENCGIVRYMIILINMLTAVAGMAIIGSVMIGGFEYMTAQDNSGQVQSARKRIIWAIVALGMLIFMYAFLEWLVPGDLI